jgi:pimeloyl-ACP methyl ester carboxylesterase
VPWPGRAGGGGDALRVFESFALAPVLSQLSVPLLVLHGEDDRLGPWDAEQAAAATLNSPRAGIVCDWVTGILSGEPFR